MPRPYAHFPLTALAAIALISSPAFAGGLALPEPNAAALGRAGTSAALPEGPSTVYYNPAGIAIGHGLSLEAGVAADIDRSAITMAGATSRTSTTTATPSLFITQRLGDHFGVGLGFRRAPGQSLEYPDDFAGRFHIQRASFSGTTLSPAVAGRPFEWLAIGFSLDVTFGDLDFAQGQGDLRYETRLSYTGKAIGLGGSMGLWARLYKDYLNFAWTYHSAMDLDYSGRTARTVPPSLTSLAVEDASMTLPMPHLLTFALGSRPRKGTSVQLEARMGILRDFDGFVLKDTAQPPSTLVAVPVSNRYLVQLRAGAEQLLVHERLAVRLGLGYDLGAARRDLDPAFPDGDRVVVSAGIGYHRPDFQLDAGYMGSFSPGSTGNRGHAILADYSQQRHSIGATLTIRIAHIGPKPLKFN